MPKVIENEVHPDWRDKWIKKAWWDERVYSKKDGYYEQIPFWVAYDETYQVLGTYETEEDAKQELTNYVKWGIPGGMREVF